MKSMLRPAVLLAVIILSCWGCGYFPLPTSPSDPSPSEPTPVVPDPAVPTPVVPIAVSIADVIAETNNQRRINGIGFVVENSKLNAAADFKMRDMFARQYFDHYGPGQTSGITELLVRFNYQYVAATENLALGDFKNANELVSLWMSSPGHRANILNGVYREIGVATGYDVFQGRRTMIAVQIFGTPRS